MRCHKLLALGAIGIGLAAYSCRSVDSHPTSPQGSALQSGAQTGGDLQLCASITGNGQFIYSHFGALTTILEDIGWIDMLAGGSSASVTQFIYAAMASSEFLNDCPDELCKRQRVAFMLKTLTGYAASFASTDPDILGMRALYDWLRLDVDWDAIEADHSKILTLFSEENAAFKRVAEIINPDVLALAQAGEFEELYSIISFPLEWKLSDPAMLIRPGLINFKKLVEQVNRASHLYVGRSADPTIQGLQGRFKSLMTSSCASEVKGSPSYWSAQSQCAMGLMGVMAEYQRTVKNLSDADEARLLNRAAAPVGSDFPVLIHSAMMTGDSANSINTAYSSYFDDYLPQLIAGRSPQSPQLTYASEFKDIKIGYWGRPEHLRRLAAPFNTAEASAMFGIGGDAYYLAQWKEYSGRGVYFTDEFTTWAEALVRSPAEPGLANMVPTGDMYSAGGWPNGRAVHNLKKIGCQKVIALTLPNISSYSIEVLNNLAPNDMEGNGGQFGWLDFWPRSEADYDEGKKSWWYREMDAADAIHCINWGKLPQTQILERFDLGYEHFNFYDRGHFGLSEDRYADRADASYDLPPFATARPCVSLSEFQ